MNFFKQYGIILSIISYLILGLYCLVVTFTTPFIGIKLTEQGDNWVIEEITYYEWAEQNNIKIGDSIKAVDGQPVHTLPFIETDQILRTASSIQVLNEGKINQIEVSNTDIYRQVLTHLLIPSSYYICTLIIVLLLNYKISKQHTLVMLILFLESVALAYISSGASSRLNTIGILINGTFLILCLVFFIHFLKKYFEQINISWPFIDNIRKLYTLPLITIFIISLSLINSQFLTYKLLFILVLFSILLVIILYIVIHTYIRTNTVQLKLLLYSIILPFSPFFLLYVIPEILFGKHIIPAEFSILFILMIPYSFIFTQLTNRLFDLEYHITRLNYYMIYALIFSFFEIVVFFIFLNDKLSLKDYFLVFTCLFLLTIILFYFKEHIDYRKRKVLFSSTGDYVHKLYKSIETIDKEVRFEQIMERMCKILKEQFQITEVYPISYDIDMNSIKTLSANGPQSIEIPNQILQRLNFSHVEKYENTYFACLQENVQNKVFIVMTTPHNVKLKNEELLWLELLIIYVNGFIGNAKVIEELSNKVTLQKAFEDSQLSLLNRLLHIKFDKELQQLAQNLHDSILQEQLYIARELDLITKEALTTEAGEKLSSIHHSMVNAIFELRAYCEELNPPLLDTHGLYIALTRLINLNKERAAFQLNSLIDRIYLPSENEELAVFRIFQELLNNALKHSEATFVTLNLTKRKTGFEIHYYDNGKGFNVPLALSNDTMGLKGIQNRVYSLNGSIHFESSSNEGTKISIEFSKGFENI